MEASGGPGGPGPSGIHSKDDHLEVGIEGVLVLLEGEARRRSFEAGIEGVALHPNRK